MAYKNKRLVTLIEKDFTETKSYADLYPEVVNQLHCE